MSNRQLLGIRVPLGLFFLATLAALSLFGCGSGGQDGSDTAASADSAEMALGRRQSDTTPPSIPTDLFANAISSAQIDLAWSASTDNRAVAGYRVLRNDSQIATLADVTEFEDTGLNASTEYAYTIEAMDGAGNISGQSAVAIATTPAMDGTPPTVSSVSIGDAGTPVAVNSAITVDFSTAMAKSTINPNTFKVVTRKGVPIAGAVSVRGNTATFTPSANLPADTEHTATVTTDVTDAAGTAMATNFAMTFVTAAVTDTTPPKVSSTFPANGATDGAPNAAVSVVFSEAMTNATLTTTSFTLKKTSGGTVVGGTVKVSGNTATFTPSAVLAKSTQYTATMTTGARDAAGNALGANYTWTFATGAVLDATPPQVPGVWPGNGTTKVALNTSIKARFSEAMSNSTLTTASIRLRPTSSQTPVSGTVNVSGIYAEFIPSAALAANTQYTATVTTAAKDAAGNPLAANFSWTFTTGAVLDTTPPTVFDPSPKISATGVPLNSSVSATFSEAMRNSTLTTASVTVTKAGGGTAVTGTVSVNSYSVTFTPTAALVENTQYTAIITTAARDAAGNPLATNYSWSFTTASATTTAALAWDAVAATSLGGYRIYYGTSPGAYVQAAGQGLNVGNVTAYTVAGLSRGIRYYFAVVAFNTSNTESAFSNEVFKDIP